MKLTRNKHRFYQRGRAGCNQASARFLAIVVTPPAFVAVFEVQFHIPPVFPQSQEVDSDLGVMRSHIPLHLGYPFLNRSSRLESIGAFLPLPLFQNRT
jgi:hypothetical protein